MSNKSISILGINELFKLLSISGDSSLSKAGEILKNEEIDGETLLTLSSSDFDSLGFKYGPKKAINEFLKKNQNQPPNKKEITTKVEPISVEIAKDNNDGETNAESSTEFEIKNVKSDNDDNWSSTIQPNIKEPYNPSSYGEFTVKVFGKNNNEILTEKIKVTPDSNIQLPELIKILDNNGQPKANCKVVLVKYDWLNNKETEIFTKLTNSSGEVNIEKDLEDGSYIIRTIPKELELKAKQINMVIALGLRNEVLNVETKPQPSSYSRKANITSLPSDIKNIYGNSIETDSGLIRQNGLKGSTVIILNFCHDSFCTNRNATNLKSSLEWTGLQVILSESFENIKNSLYKACQLWIISSHKLISVLTEAEQEIIIDFYKKGNGLYLWGDNHPYYTEANALGSKLIGVTMSGNTPGQKNIGLTLSDYKSGFKNHKIFSGVSTLYEGITIATIDISKAKVTGIKPLVYGSANNLVTILYKDLTLKTRLMMDSGFTRLFDGFWDKAGTNRFVVNSAGWLANLQNKRPSIHAITAMDQFNNPQ